MKKIILCIILLCIVLLSGCFQSSKYPKYEIEKQDNGQYILTTPDGVSYVTYENNIWYPGEEILGENINLVNLFLKYYENLAANIFF